MPPQEATADLYELLGVARDASLATVRTAYRAKMVQHHPSKGGDPAVLASISEAYAVLISAPRRKLYDETGRIEPLQQGPVQEALGGPAGNQPHRRPTEKLPERRLPEPAAPDGKSDAGELLCGRAQIPAGDEVNLTSLSDVRQVPPEAVHLAVGKTGGQEPSVVTAGVPLVDVPAKAKPDHLAELGPGTDAGAAARPAAEELTTTDLRPDRPAMVKPLVDAPAKQKPMADHACAQAEVMMGGAPAKSEPVGSLSSRKKPGDGSRTKPASNNVESPGPGDAAADISGRVTPAVGCDNEHATPTLAEATSVADMPAYASPVLDAPAKSKPLMDAPAKVKTLADALAAAEASADAAEDVAEQATPALPSKPARPPPGAPLTAAVECEGPVLYRCSQGVLFAKRSTEPTGKTVVKLARPIGTFVHSTGRFWKGPSGGTWCELQDGEHFDNMRWMLVKGPGFGLAGPALMDASVLQAGAFEAVCLHVKNVSSSKDSQNLVVFESFMSKSATIWGVKKAVQEATNLNANYCYLSNELPGKAPTHRGDDRRGHNLPADFMKEVKDDQTLKSLDSGGDIVLFLVYIGGSFDQDYKPSKPLANGGA
mmetsp:Transcript_106995/g.332455  ORF Transcript_106995/g.332455 Transcript_106995/m.332455 type:complete len:598 (+) Transcript_106995:239-2032(+)